MSDFEHERSRRLYATEEPRTRPKCASLVQEGESGAGFMLVIPTMSLLLFVLTNQVPLLAL